MKIIFATHRLIIAYLQICSICHHFETHRFIVTVLLRVLGYQ